MKHFFSLYRLLCIAGMLFSTTTLTTAQQRVEYTYDQAGNRLTRKIVILSPRGVKQAPTDSIPVKQQWRDRIIIIYPNPTRGALAIEIQGGKDTDKIIAELFNSSGAMLYARKWTGTAYTIDMRAYVTGIYILRIKINEEMNEYKIIKL